MSNPELRIIPHPSFARSHSHLASSAVSAPSAPGVYDRLRGSLPQAAGPASSGSSHFASLPGLSSAHPLEARLVGWSSTREQLKHALLQREFGLAAPLQREMELLAVRSAAYGSMLGFMDMSGSGRGCGIHEDILMGRDAELDWEDVYPGPGWGEASSSGGSGAWLGGDFHSAMEHRLFF